MRSPLVIGAILILLLSYGCCDIFTPGTNETVDQNITPVGPANLYPTVSITLNASEGAAPFYPRYSFSCYDPDNQLVLCELMMDGQVYAQGPTQDLFGKDYVRPQFYYNLTSTVGNHTITILAENAAGLNASENVTFTVLPPPDLTAPGWYTCNGKANPPCDIIQQGYCDKFDPTDISVREAAAEAIAKDPGEFSINQLLDIYDWVHANVFYQNVPLTMWPPYYPNQTLLTRSGDCKNQAVLIASMVEAIGGSARVLVIPDCEHAFPEVYVGNQSNVDTLNSAVRAHYPDASGQVINWHTSTDADNVTTNWMIFDTAGGWFPGNTISDCLNVSHTFELDDCNANGALNAPQVQGTEFGPTVIINDTEVLAGGGYGYHYWYDTTKILPSQYSYCSFNADVRSLSSAPLTWYITDQTGYDNFAAGRPFSQYYQEANVLSGSFNLIWNTHGTVYFILQNNNPQTAITTHIQVVMTCYK